jgi:ATP-binding cassette subfamily C protein
MPKVLRKLLDLLTRRERWQLLGLLGLLLVGGGLETLGVGVVFSFVSALDDPELVQQQPLLRGLYAALGEPALATFWLGLGVALMAVYAGKNAYLAGMYYLQYRFIWNKQVTLSDRLFRQYLYAPYTFHLQRNTAQLLRNVTNEIQQLFLQVLTPVAMLLTELVVAGCLVGFLIVMEPVASLAATGVLVAAMGAFYAIFRRWIGGLGQQRQYHNGQLFQQVNQGLGGIKEAKVLRRGPFFVQQHRYHRRAFARAWRFNQTLQQMPRLYVETVAVVGLLTIAVALLWQGRSAAAVIPTLSLFAAAAFRLMPSLNRIIGSLNKIRFGTRALDLLHHELVAGEVPTERASGGDRAVPALQQQLALRGVSYRYPNAAAEALQDVSLTVPKGHSVGFVGSTGAGKTTLVDVLLGLLAPTQGQVLVDGADIQGDLAGWQRQIGYIPQQIYLCDDTLRGNIAFGVPETQIEEASVRAAVRAAQLEALVSELPNGLETVVGERGVRLSGGQRQRVGIARALYHNPQVLVMDEATAALDNETETGVMAAVEQLSGEKTLLIIAHRLSTVKNCGCLYFIEAEKITDCGSHEDLLERNK